MPQHCGQVFKASAVLAAVMMALTAVTMQEGPSRSGSSILAARRLQLPMRIPALLNGLDEIQEDQDETNESSHVGMGSHPTISPEDLQVALQKLRQEADAEAAKMSEAIRHRHHAELFLKERDNDIDLAVCEAASKFYQFEVLQELLKMGGSVNKKACGSVAGTALQEAAHWSIDQGIPRIINELGGDPNVPNENGEPPLYMACSWMPTMSSSAVIKRLKEGGADVDAKIDDSPMVVHAAQKKLFHVTQCLLEHGAAWPWNKDAPTLKVHGKDYRMSERPASESDMGSRLCAAAQESNHGEVLSYLTAGANIDAAWCWTPNLPWFTTPLGHATLHGRKDMVELLLNLGASRDPAPECVEKKSFCPEKSCFGCASACEAFQSRGEMFMPRKEEDYEGLSSILGCKDALRSSLDLQQQIMKRL